MCFSAPASFTTAFGLALTALVSLKKVKRKEQIMLASVPLLFALQQFSEGFVWLSTLYNVPSFIAQAAAYTYLTFALVIWPLWITPSLLLLEKEKKRKRILQVFFVVGILWSAALAWYLYSAQVVAQVHASNMCYLISTFDVASKYMGYFLLIYLIPVILPFFVSSEKNIWIFGIAGLLSCALTYYFWFKCFLSVWCFFAAVLSVLLILIFPE